MYNSMPYITAHSLIMKHVKMVCVLLLVLSHMQYCALLSPPWLGWVGYCRWSWMPTLRGGCPSLLNNPYCLSISTSCCLCMMFLVVSLCTCLSRESDSHRLAVLPDLPQYHLHSISMLVSMYACGLTCSSSTSLVSVNILFLLVPTSLSHCCCSHYMHGNWQSVIL